jgi:hypothetical protein
VNQLLIASFHMTTLDRLAIKIQQSACINGVRKLYVELKDNFNGAWLDKSNSRTLDKRERNYGVRLWLCMAVPKPELDVGHFFQTQPITNLPVFDQVQPNPISTGARKKLEVT